MSDPPPPPPPYGGPAPEVNQVQNSLQSIQLVPPPGSASSTQSIILADFLKTVSPAELPRLLETLKVFSPHLTGQIPVADQSESRVFGGILGDPSSAHQGDTPAPNMHTTSSIHNAATDVASTNPPVAASTSTASTAADPGHDHIPQSSGGEEGEEDDASETSAKLLGYDSIEDMNTATGSDKWSRTFALLVARADAEDRVLTDAELSILLELDGATRTHSLSIARRLRNDPPETLEAILQPLVTALDQAEENIERDGSVIDPADSERRGRKAQWEQEYLQLFASTMSRGMEFMLKHTKLTLGQLLPHLPFKDIPKGTAISTAAAKDGNFYYNVFQMLHPNPYTDKTPAQLRKAEDDKTDLSKLDINKVIYRPQGEWNAVVGGFWQHTKAAFEQRGIFDQVQRFLEKKQLKKDGEKANPLVPTADDLAEDARVRHQVFEKFHQGLVADANRLRCHKIGLTARVFSVAAEDGAEYNRAVVNMKSLEKFEERYGLPGSSNRALAAQAHVKAQIAHDQNALYRELLQKAGLTGTDLFVQPVPDPEDETEGNMIKLLDPDVMDVDSDLEANTTEPAQGSRSLRPRTAVAVSAKTSAKKKAKDVTTVLPTTTTVAQRSSFFEPRPNIRDVWMVRIASLGSPKGPALDSITWITDNWEQLVGYERNRGKEMLTTIFLFFMASHGLIRADSMDTVRKTASSYLIPSLVRARKTLIGWPVTCPIPKHGKVYTEHKKKGDNGYASHLGGLRKGPADFLQWCLLQNEIKLVDWPEDAEYGRAPSPDLVVCTEYPDPPHSYSGGDSFIRVPQTHFNYWVADTEACIDLASKARRWGKEKQSAWDDNDLVKDGVTKKKKGRSVTAGGDEGVGDADELEDEGNDDAEDAPVAGGRSAQHRKRKVVHYADEEDEIEDDPELGPQEQAKRRKTTAGTNTERGQAPRKGRSKARPIAKPGSLPTISEADTSPNANEATHPTSTLIATPAATGGASTSGQRPAARAATADPEAPRTSSSTSYLPTRASSAQPEIHRQFVDFVNVPPATPRRNLSATERVNRLPPSPTTNRHEQAEIEGGVAVPVNPWTQNNAVSAPATNNNNLPATPASSPSKPIVFNGQEYHLKDLGEEELDDLFLAIEEEKRKGREKEEQEAKEREEEAAKAAEKQRMREKRAKLREMAGGN